jgi:hypothetical protein
MERGSSISHNQISKMTDLLITHALQFEFYGELMVSAGFYIAHGLISAFVFSQPLEVFANLAISALAYLVSRCFLVQ